MKKDILNTKGGEKGFRVKGMCEKTKKVTIFGFKEVEEYEF